MPGAPVKSKPAETSCAIFSASPTAVAVTEERPLLGRKAAISVGECIGIIDYDV